PLAGVDAIIRFIKLRLVDEKKAQEKEKDFPPCYPTNFRARADVVVCLFTRFGPFKPKDLGLEAGKEYKIETSSCPQLVTDQEKKDTFFQDYIILKIKSKK
ncbi:MAG: hypothetical protein ACK413_03275, partial [Patescibacteria group bacterium]